MNPDQIKVIEQIKVHVTIINELFQKLQTPVKIKSKKGLTPEENARLDARLRKKMYR